VGVAGDLQAPAALQEAGGYRGRLGGDSYPYHSAGIWKVKGRPTHGLVLGGEGSDVCS